MKLLVDTHMNTSSSEELNNQKIQYATFWERFGALFLDSMVLWILLAFIGNLFHENPDHVFIGISFSIKGAVLRIMVGWLYFAIQECSVYQGTIGKRTFKIKVTDTKLQRISFVKASLRYFSKIISSAILCFGYFMMLWNDAHQTLHDKLAATFVIK